MFLPNPGVLAAGVSVSNKTYAEFVTHITSLTGGVERGWLDEGSWSLSGGAVLVTATAVEAGNMTGSSWDAPFRGAAAGTAATCRVVQHGLPSLESFMAQGSGGRKMLVRTDTATAPSGYSSKTRNGYTSISSDITTGGRFCVEIIAWIDGQPMRMQPYLGLGPEPYDWT